jgi:hypothetical protein
MTVDLQLTLLYYSPHKDITPYIALLFRDLSTFANNKKFLKVTELLWKQGKPAEFSHTTAHKNGTQNKVEIVLLMHFHFFTKPDINIIPTAIARVMSDGIGELLELIHTTDNRPIFVETNFDEAGTDS